VTGVQTCALPICYAWRWSARLAKLAGLYLAVVQGLLFVEAGAEARGFLRGVLLVAFPLLLSGLIFDLGRRFRARLTLPAEGEKPGRGRRAVLLLARFWTWPAVVYAWATFIFLIGDFKAGFNYLLLGSLGTLATAAGLTGGWRLVDLGQVRLLALNGRLKDRLPGLEEKLRRYLAVLRLALRTLLLLAGLALAAQAWGLPAADWLGAGTGSVILARLLAVLLTVGLGVVIMEVGDLVVQRLLGEAPGRVVSRKRKTLTPLILTAVKAAVVFVGGVVVLDRLGVDVKPILAGAGIIGLAVGFGAQSLVKDVINGLFILAQDVIAVGDVVTVAGKSGVVEAVGLRAVTLRDLSGNVHVIPNSAIEAVTNMAKGYSRQVLDIGVGYGEDVDRVMAVLAEVGRELAEDAVFGPKLAEPAEVMGVERFDDSAVVLRVRLTTKPLEQWTVAREYRRRLKAAFDRAGIALPFPQRTVHIAPPQEGPAPTRLAQGKKEDPRKGG
jgi:small conductance mechanosensitive channel